MSFEYQDLVRDVADRTVNDYMDYMDNLEPDENALSPYDFATDTALYDEIDNVLIPTHAIWQVIMEHCENPNEVLSGEAPDFGGESAYVLFYDDCLNEFLEQEK